MRSFLTIGFALLCVGSLGAAAQQTPSSDQQVDLSSIETVIVSAQTHLAALDQLIAAQEVKLDGLYEQKEAAANADLDARADQFDAIIARMNLTLTNLEAERDGIAATIGTLQDQIANLKPEEPTQIEEQSQ